MTVFKATNGYGVWYGSLDGETWVHFPCEPRPGDEAHIAANLEPEGHGSAIFPAWQRQAPVTHAELVQRRFYFASVEYEPGKTHDRSTQMTTILEVIEVAPETKALLQEEAARRELSLAQVIGEMLDDLAQDKEDAEEAQRILAGGDLSDCKTLDDLRKAWGK
jgi:hypothetical protein